LEQLLSIQDLAEYLDVPIQTVYRWRAAGGGPPGFRVGRHVRFRAEDVETWLRSRADAQRCPTCRS